jgi:AcrR family transcriptional regulator
MKSDARVRYTKKVLRESLLQLMKTKPIHGITVKEICELAEINRATFYTHYTSPYDLLEQIEDELFDQMSTRVIKNFKEDTLTEVMELAFDIIAENIELCRVIFSENGNKRFLDRVMQIARETTISSWKADFPRATENQMDYLFSFIISGAVAVIERWVRIGMKETPIELAENVSKLAQIWLRKTK